MYYIPINTIAKLFILHIQELHISMGRSNDICLITVSQRGPKISKLGLKKVGIYVLPKKHSGGLSSNCQIYDQICLKL